MAMNRIKLSDIEKAKKAPRYKFLPKSFWKSLEKIGEDRVTNNPVERCHLRWFFLFDKILKVLFERDPNLVTNIRFTLYKSGLDSPFKELNPSDETLTRAKAFHEGQISSLKLRGKQKSDGENRFYPIYILHDYLKLLSAFQDLPKSFRNPYTRRRIVENRLKEIIDNLIGPKKKVTGLPDEIFKGFSLPKKELVVRLLAHFYGPIGKGSIRTYLTRGKRLFPEYRDDKIKDVSSLEGQIKYLKSKSRDYGLDPISVKNWVEHGIKKEVMQAFFK
jgi:hypothetical protein